MSTAKKNICVFTSIIGAYEQLNEQPDHIRETADFICFADSDVVGNGTWRVEKIEPAFPDDRQRSQRYIKMLQHPTIEKYDFSIYIDNSVILAAPADEIVQQFLGDDHDLAISKHSFRNCVIDEFQAVSDLAYDEQKTILRQLEAYATYFPNVLLQKPYWCGLIIRRNGIKSVERMMDTWLHQVLVHSRRDQLSVNLAISKSVIRLNTMDIDNNQSQIHSWPYARGRPKNMALVDMARELNDAKAISTLVSSINGGNQRVAMDQRPITVACQTLHLQAGANSVGAGGEVSFGVAQFEDYAPMASIGGYLENAPQGETQGGLSFKTRSTGLSAQELEERMRINSDGTLTLIPTSGKNASLAGTLYFDKSLGLLVSLDGHSWRAVETRVISDALE